MHKYILSMVDEWFPDDLIMKAFDHYLILNNIHANRLHASLNVTLKLEWPAQHAQVSRDIYHYMRLSAIVGVYFHVSVCRVYTSLEDHSKELLDKSFILSLSRRS